MMFRDEPIIETKKGFGCAYLFAFIFLLFGLMFVIFRNTDCIYYQFSDLPSLFGIVFITCSIITLFIPFTYSKILFFENHLYFEKNKKDFLYADILNLEILEYKDDDGVINKNCGITFNDLEIGFSNSTVKNYDEIISFLKSKNIITGQKLPYKFRIKVAFTNSFLGLMVVSMLIMFIATFIFWDYGMKMSRNKDSVKITMTTIINNKPLFTWSENDDDDDLIEFHSSDFPNTNLFLKQKEVSEEYLNYIHDFITVNDSIRISVSKHDYLTKIKKTINPSFWDKHFEWDRIKLFGLEHNKNVILNSK